MTKSNNVAATEKSQDVVTFQLASAGVTVVNNYACQIDKITTIGEAEEAFKVLNASGRVSSLGVAKLVEKVYNSKLYTQFAKKIKFEEYTQQVFKIGKAMSYQYVSVAYFINSDCKTVFDDSKNSFAYTQLFTIVNESGLLKLKTKIDKLAQKIGKADPEKVLISDREDLKAAQVAYQKEYAHILGLVKDGMLTSQMTVKEIQKSLKKVNAESEVKESNNSSEKSNQLNSENEGESSEKENAESEVKESNNSFENKEVKESNNSFENKEEFEKEINDLVSRWNIKSLTIVLENGYKVVL